MQLRDTILLTQHKHGPAGSDFRHASISDKSSDILIASLRKYNIGVNYELSEETVVYDVRNGRTVSKKTATVPLGTTFPCQVRLQTLTLRDDNGLELTLRDYKDITHSPPEGVFGGYVAGDFGISCDVVLEGRNVDPKISDSVRQAVAEAYDILA